MENSEFMDFVGYMTNGTGKLPNKEEDEEEEQIHKQEL